MVILGAGFALGAASIVLWLADGGSVLHLIGYLIGSVIPVLLIGVFRRSDLDRRRSPYYLPNRYVRPALFLLALLALIVAGLHVWPIATDMAS
jgi:hypothetical protein